MGVKCDYAILVSTVYVREGKQAIVTLEAILRSGSTNLYSTRQSLRPVTEMGSRSSLPLL